MNKNKKILVTGAAGFIGWHISIQLLKNGFGVVGIDNLNDYYDVSLKADRLRELRKFKSFIFHKIDIKEKELTDNIFETYRPEYVVHLAAQAGVRHSIDNPYKYLDSNLIGFMNVLEACRNYPVKQLIYASSSSVYGGNTITPFSTSHKADHPVSLYAATKKTNELLAHTYSHLYGIPTTGLRFFTVYGPWGRPDMAYFKFTKYIYEGRSIDIYNHGEMERDFTYIDDVTEGIYGLIEKPPVPDAAWDESNDNGGSFAPYKVYNIGKGNPEKLERFISLLEEKIGKKAKRNYMAMQPGDVLKTYADISGLESDIGFKPKTSLEEGLEKFVDWYRKYYKTVS